YFTLSDSGILATKLLISKKVINGGLYTWSRHLLQKISYFATEKGLLASMGKEIVNLTANKLYRVQPILETDEYISNFSVTETHILYTTEKYEKQESGSNKFGYVNSLSSCNVKIMNIDNNKLIVNKVLNPDAIYFIS